MFLTLFLVAYHVLVWLRELADLAVLKSAFEEVLTIEASPVLLLLDAAPEPEPVPISHAADNSWHNFLLFLRRPYRIGGSGYGGDASRYWPCDATFHKRHIEPSFDSAG